MATYGRTMRRGLPRQSGGERWPPADAVPADLHDDGTPEPAPEPIAQIKTAARTTARPVRRGLPRVPGGEPWPPAGGVPTAVPSAPVHDPDKPERTPVPGVEPAGQAEKPAVAASTSEPALQPQPGSSFPVAATAAGTTLLRRGLPRVPGGEPWPPETAVNVEPAPEAREHMVAPPTPEKVEVPDPAPIPAPVKPAPVAAAPSSDEVAVAAAAPAGATRAPLPPRPAGREKTPGRKPRSRTAKMLLSVVGLLAVALAAVFFMRWLVTLGFMQDFLTRYPGETALPAGAEPGFSAWVQWQHFFNFFLIVLIIRSGLQVRRETRPPGYWTPRWSKGGDGKISINLWFHQALDILWLLNGLVFVVLLFVTGHWVRLVPTTWEVFPNALSAAIQYVSLDWPTENGWVNYNSLQMLAYFVTVFIAAPLAVLSGIRMSGLWPKGARTLNRIYPLEWARAVHFPVMLYFVVFIIGHVALVFATGALRNLNHMYGGQDAVNWAGFWIFFVSLLLVAGAWIAARPVVLAPVAGLFGRVSSR